MSDSNRNAREHNEYRLNRSRQSAGVGRSSSTGERSSRPETKESEPEWRSMARVEPPSNQERIFHHETPLHRAAPDALSHMPQLRSYSRPQPKHLEQRFRSKSEGALPRNVRWVVDHESLRPRPDDLPPLRTSRVVQGAKAGEISTRIMKCLQSRSIKTKFCKSDANIVKCRNTGYCKFIIRLYLVEEEEEEEKDEGGVLVEVHRLCGDCICFMKDCRAILNAAEGRKGESHPSDDKPLYLRIPVSEMAFAKSASLPEISTQDEVDTVKTTATLLSSQQSDTNMLGMELLVVQTDALKTLKSTALLAARRVLCPEDEANKDFNLHNYVMSLLIYGNEHPPSYPEDSALEDHSMKLRNLAISAVANALSLFATENKLLHTISENREWYVSVFIPCLLQDLSLAEHRPHDACYASRCLATLAKESGEFASKIEGGHVAIAKAQEVGKNEFAMLELDAKTLLSCCV